MQQQQQYQAMKSFNLKAKVPSTLASPNRQLSKDVQSFHPQGSSLLKISVTNQERNFKSPDEQIQRRLSNQGSKKQLVDMISSPRNQMTSQHQEFKMKSAQQIKNLLKHQQDQLRNQNPVQYDKIMNENLQLKKEISLLKNIINYVVPPEILQKTREDLQIQLESDEFNESMDLKQFNINRQTATNQNRPVQKGHSSQRKKSTAPIPKIVCQESFKEVNNLDIDEFDFTTSESHRLRKYSEESKSQGFKNLPTFGNNDHSNALQVAQQQKPKFNQGNQAQFFENPGFTLSQNQNLSSKETSILREVSQNQGYHKSKLSCGQAPGRNIGSQQFNSNFSNSIYNNSFLSDDETNPINSTQKKSILCSPKNYDFIPDSKAPKTVKREQQQQFLSQFLSIDRNHNNNDGILSKKIMSYPKPLENVSQNAFSSMSITQEFSNRQSVLQDFDEDQLLDKNLLNAPHQLEEIQEDHQQQSFQQEAHIGDHDEQPMSLSAHSFQSQNSDDNQAPYIEVYQPNQDPGSEFSEVQANHQALQYYSNHEEPQILSQNNSKSEIIQYLENNQEDQCSSVAEEDQAYQNLEVKKEFSSENQHSSEILRNMAEYRDMIKTSVEEEKPELITMEKISSATQQILPYQLSQLDCQESEQHFDTGRNEEERLEKMFQDFCNNQIDLEAQRAQPKHKEVSSHTASQNFSSSNFHSDNHPEGMFAFNYEQASSLLVYKGTAHQVIEEQPNSQEDTVKEAENNVYEESNQTYLEILNKKYENCGIGVSSRNITPAQLLSPKGDIQTIASKRAKSTDPKTYESGIYNSSRNTYQDLKRHTSVDKIKWTSKEDKEKNIIQLNQQLMRKTFESFQSGIKDEDKFNCPQILHPQISPSREFPDYQQNNVDLQSMNMMEESFKNQNGLTALESLRIIKLERIDESPMNFDAQIDLQNLEIQDMQRYQSNKSQVKEETEISIHLYKEYESQQLSEGKNSINKSNSKGRFTKLAEGLKQLRQQQEKSNSQLDNYKSFAEENEQNNFTLRNVDIQANDLTFQKESNQTPSPRNLDSSLLFAQSLLVQPAPQPQYPQLTDFYDQETQEKSQREQINQAKSQVQEQQIVDEFLDKVQTSQRSLRNKIQLAQKVLSQYNSLEKEFTDNPMKIEFPNNDQLRTQYNNLLGNQIFEDLYSPEKKQSLKTMSQATNSNSQLHQSSQKSIPISVQSSEEQIIICAQQEHQLQYFNPFLPLGQQQQQKPITEIKSSFYQGLDKKQPREKIQMINHQKLEAQKKEDLAQMQREMIKTKDQSTKEMFNQIFGDHFTRTGVIEEEPSQEELESSTNQDHTHPLDNMLTISKGTSKESSQLSFSNIVMKDSEMFTTEPNFLNHRIDYDLNKQCPTQNSSPINKQVLSKTKSSENLKKHVKFLKPSILYTAGSVATQEDLDQPKSFQTFDMIINSTVSGQQPDQQYFASMSVSQHGSQPLASPRPQQKHKLLSFRSNPQASFNSSPCKTPNKRLTLDYPHARVEQHLALMQQKFGERLPNQSFERQTSTQKSDQKKEKLRQIKERRELIEKQKMEEKKEKLEKKLSKIESILEQNFSQVNNHEYFKEKAQEKAQDKKLNGNIKLVGQDYHKSSNSSRQSLEPSSLHSSNSKKPFTYRKTISSQVIEEKPEIQRDTTAAHFQRRRMNSKNTTVNTSDLESESTLPHDPQSLTHRQMSPNKQISSLSTSRNYDSKLNSQSKKSARQDSSVNTKIITQYKIQPQRSYRRISNMNSNETSKQNISSNCTSQNNSISISIKPRNPSNQYSSNLNKKSARLALKSQPQIELDYTNTTSPKNDSSINLNQFSQQEQYTRSFNHREEQKSIIPDKESTLTLSPINLQQIDQLYVDQTNERLPSQPSSSSSQHHTREAEFMRRITEDHKKRITLRGRILK